MNLPKFEFQYLLKTRPGKICKKDDANIYGWIHILFVETSLEVNDVQTEDEGKKICFSSTIF